MSVVRKAETDLKRFFDCKYIRRIFRHRSGDYTSNGDRRKC